MKILPVIIGVLVITGCSFVHPKPQEGGGASVSPAAQRTPDGQIGGVSGDFTTLPNATIKQSQNPNSSSSQAVNHENEEVIEIAVDTVKETTTTFPDGRSLTIREPIPAGSRVIRRAKSTINQELGSSWKDTGREIAAALGSFQGVQYVGIAVFLFGAVSFFNLALRTLVGGKDACLAIGGAGLVMMFGPFLFVTYSKWFFLAIVGAAVYWFLARFKYQHGRLDAIENQQK